ncbi:MAG: hypothetical protein WCJ61_11230, partial [Paludibacter sp.]
MNKFIKIRGKCLQALLLFPILVLAQGINIGSSASISIIGAPTIKIIDGNFVNNGTFNKGAETVIMSGTTAATMTGSGTTTMYNL